MEYNSNLRLFILFHIKYAVSTYAYVTLCVSHLKFLAKHQVRFVDCCSYTDH